ncbi:MAG: 7-carboxy-7-deazaguanine synthase QueE [Bacteroidales bacterium]|jgi:7-carboxy-7-deazaguanine synthase|nr:7-carboxy-7-deazaguanine synthase QueE [Bacteroidales bacterium]
MSDNRKEEQTLPIVEMFYSIQGEGYHTGKPAYFIRLGGCNVLCGWCDVKESWNPDIHPQKTIPEIVDLVLSQPAKSVVITGGEPLMNNLDKLCEALQSHSIKIFLETNGTYELSGRWDWICLSPKLHHEPRQDFYAYADELKIIIDSPERLQWAETCKDKVGENCILYLQPEWKSSEKILPVIINYCKLNPEWNISIQTHKYLNIP